MTKKPGPDVADEAATAAEFVDGLMPQLTAKGFANILGSVKPKEDDGGASAVGEPSRSPERPHSLKR
jgi:hypothetical protein